MYYKMIMAKRNEIYKCAICGNVVEVVHEGGGQLSCCGKPMMLMSENTTDGAIEKHVPVVEKIEGGYKVCVGSMAHPMSDEHHIEWIELHTDCGVMRKYLKPGNEPVVIFKTNAEPVCVREYCNLHGLWKCSCADDECCDKKHEAPKDKNNCHMKGDMCFFG